MARVWKAIYVEEGHEGVVDRALETLAKDLEPVFDYDGDWDKVKVDDADEPAPEHHQPRRDEYIG